MIQMLIDAMLILVAFLIMFPGVAFVLMLVAVVYMIGRGMERERREQEGRLPRIDDGK